MSRRAVFLDRDGVLMRDLDLLVDPAKVELLPGVPQALAALAGAGYALVVVSNQPVVARGLAALADVEAVNAKMAADVVGGGGPPFDRVAFCPHHPHATVDAYRLACPCRKPRPGMLFAAATELDLDLARSFLVGDRASDIEAGRRAGVRTVLVETGAHLLPPIVSVDGPYQAHPDHRAADLAAAAAWILAAGAPT